MSKFVTVFGSLEKHQKGHLEIIEDNPKYYTFSNVFEVASRSRPYEKVVVARNLDFVIEAIRAEGTSGWMAASHDEFVLAMDGEVEVELWKLDRPGEVAPQGKDGTVRLEGEPQGRRMGRIQLRRGHQALLPVGAAYRFKAGRPSVLLQQTIRGPHSVEKWADICLR
jgi:hypothetical protein